MSCHDAPFTPHYNEQETNYDEKKQRCSTLIACVDPRREAERVHASVAAVSPWLITRRRVFSSMDPVQLDMQTSFRGSYVSFQRKGS